MKRNIVNTFISMDNLKNIEESRKELGDLISKYNNIRVSDNYEIEHFDYYGKNKDSILYAKQVLTNEVSCFIKWLTLIFTQNIEYSEEYVYDARFFKKYGDSLTPNSIYYDSNDRAFVIYSFGEKWFIQSDHPIIKEYNKNELSINEVMKIISEPVEDKSEEPTQTIPEIDMNQVIDNVIDGLKMLKTVSNINPKDISQGIDLFKTFIDLTKKGK